MSEQPAAMELVDGLKEEQMDQEEPTNEDQTEQQIDELGENGEAEAEAEAEAETGADVEGEGDADDTGDANEEQLAEAAQMRRDKEQRNKKRVRNKLRMLDEMTSRDDQIVSQLLDANQSTFSHYIGALNSIHHKIGDKDVTASLADADILKRMGGYGLQQARQLTAVRQRSLEEVLQSFCRLYPADAEEDSQRGESSGIDWRAYGRRVAPLFATVTPVSFMKGVLGVVSVSKEKKKRVARRAAEDDDDENEPVARASHAAPTDETATMTDRRAVLLYHALPVEATSLFEVMFHPRDFTQTVENLFDLTFLVKKGQAAVEIDPELGIPTVRRIKEPTDEDEGEEEDAPAERQNFHCIFKIDLDVYKQLVQAFHIDKRREPFLKDRTVTNGKGGAGAAAASAAGGGRSRNKGASSAAVSAGSAAASRRGGAQARVSIDAASVDGDSNPDDDAASHPSALERIPAFFSPSQPSVAHVFARQSRNAEQADTPSSGSPNKRQRRNAQHEEGKDGEMSEQD